MKKYNIAPSPKEQWKLLSQGTRRLESAEMYLAELKGINNFIRLFGEQEFQKHLERIYSN